MDDLRYAAIAALLGTMRVTGLDRLAAPFLRGRGVILTLHHVTRAPEQPFQPNRILEVTPGFLDAVLRLLRAEGYEIAPLGEVAARLASDGPRFAALTFDDGYRDNLAEALPVLRAHAAPFALYVVPGFADAAAPLWWRDLEEVVAGAAELTVPFAEGPERFAAATPAEKRRAFAAIYWRLRAGPEEELRRTIAAMCAAAGVDSLGRTRRLCMGWDDIRSLAADPLCTIGAHTLTHPMLARHPEAEARREVAASRFRIEAEIGRDVRHFSYPVGDPASAGRREFALARAAGFETAVTTRPGVLHPAHAGHLMALPRISLNGLFQSAGAARTLLAGLPTAMQNRFRRLNVG